MVKRAIVLDVLSVFGFVVGVVVLVFSVISMYILGMIVGIALMIISAILEHMTARDIAKDLRSSTIPETKRNTVVCKDIVREILGVPCNKSGATKSIPLSLMLITAVIIILALYIASLLIGNLNEIFVLTLVVIFSWWLLIPLIFLIWDMEKRR